MHEAYILKQTAQRRFKTFLPIFHRDATDTKCPLLNYLIVLGKLHLWNCHRTNSLPFFPSYKQLVKRKYKTERHIAVKYSNMKMLEAKWKPVLKCNLLDT